MTISEYKINVTLEAPSRYMAKVFKKTGTTGDMRESWDTWDVIGVALGPDEGDAIHDAVNEAFFGD